METPLVLRPIRFPLKLKLISLFSLVLLASLAAYAHYALTRFIEDKSAYIFSSVQEAASAQSRDVEQIIDEAKRALAVMLEIEDAASVKNIFERFPSFMDYREYSQKTQQFTLGIADPSALSRNNITKEDLDNKANELVTKAMALPPQMIHLLYPHQDRSIVTLIYRSSDDRIQIAQVGLSDVLNARADAIKTFVLGPSGEQLLTNGSQKLFEFANTRFLQRNIKQGVIEEKIQDEPHLIGVQIAQAQYPISIALISKGNAFAVADNLIEKSYLFAVFLLSIAIIIGILFSRSLTRSLETLFQGTQSFVSGNFESRVNVKSSDEIGALSDSFNYMGRKIVDFMLEMKEKIRLEREVEVAKLVQDSFFPEMHGDLNALSFSAFYAPASECGGDWWGHIDLEDRTIVFIADATGHGVPAALITATANCGLHTLEEVLRTNPELSKKPAKMLEWFNKAICGAGKQLYMTMLCIVVDKNNHVLTWANAAHNPALLLSADLKQPKRQDLIPLLSAPSAHLGKDIHSTFEEKSISFKPNDTLILYTDGFVENTDAEGKSYGERRFHQSIVEDHGKNISLWCQQISAKALSYSGGTPSDDDVTLVLCALDTNVEAATKVEFQSDDAVISSLSPDEALDFLYKNPQVNHLIGSNSPRLDAELKSNEPTFENTDFSWKGIELSEFRNELSSFLNSKDFPGWFESPRDYLRLISDELVTNALSNANAVVKVALSSDAKHIMLEVEDNLGILEKSTLLEALKRARETHAPKSEGRGAGLGLYLVYQSTNQIWIDVAPGKYTRVLCVLEATKRYKNFKGRFTSFHFKTQESL